MVTAWLFRFWKDKVTDKARRLLYVDASLVEQRPLTGDRFPIMRKAVRVESKRKAILFVGAAGMLRLLTLAVSAAETVPYFNALGDINAALSDDRYELADKFDENSQG